MTLATVKYKLEDDTQAANLALAESAIRLRDSLRENFPRFGFMSPVSRFSHARQPLGGRAR
ncbi:MAG: hypothetical protein CM15mP120_29670 [Pseudomonadota bacterium]|nr:MAG: hypothetical protein CM15mP120_29670 [Pseudomonadota bacterium]